nr:Na+/H+ antiporter subunit G [uncultured Desulfobulbus sp.]
MLLDLSVALFLLIGGGFLLIGSIGLLRLPDLFMRLHGPTKATTLGLGGILIGSMLHFGGRGGGLSLHELLITLFIFTTAPISAYLVGRAGLHLHGYDGERNR